MSTLSNNNMVLVNILLSGTAVPAKGFNNGLLLVKESAVPGAGRVQTFTSAADVATAFGGTGTEAYKGAAAYFSSPYNPASLKIGVFLTGGSADANAGAALDACMNFDPAFYGVALAHTDFVSADIQSAAAWCETNKARLFYTTQEADVLAPATPPTNLLYLLKQAGYARSGGIYVDSSAAGNAYAHMGLMAIFMTIDYAQPNSMRSAAFQTLAGITPAPLTQSQLQAITGTFDGVTPGWNGNVFATFGVTPQIQRGQSADGSWIDTGIALDWLQSNIQAGVLSVLVGAARAGQRVPGTDGGAQMLIGGAKPTLLQARTNGLIAPGYWNGQAAGEIATGDYLPNGYYTFASPVQLQSSADRQARKAPPISILCAGSGALQNCSIGVTFQQ